MLLVGLRSDLLDRPNDQGWSLKDIVAHLHDMEDVARVQRMLNEERPFIQSINPPARLLEGGYASRQLPELLDELEQQRSAHVAWLHQLGAEDLARSGEHDEAGAHAPAAPGTADGRDPRLLRCLRLRPGAVC